MCMLRMQPNQGIIGKEPPPECYNVPFPCQTHSAGPNCWAHKRRGARKLGRAEG